VPYLMSSGPARAGHLGVARHLLGSRLRALREKKKIPRSDAAKHIGSSAPTISRIELGQVAVKERDLERLLQLYGVTDSSQRLAYLQLAHQLSARPWWHPHKDLLAGWLCSYLALESVADLIRSYENRFIPGLLQTRSYAEAVIRQDGAARGRDLHRRVDVRMNRQQRILERNAALWAVVDEATLSNQTAGPAVMREQIDFLISMAGAERREISIQVLPVKKSAIAAAANSFSILRLRIHNLQDVVYLEQLNSALFLDDPSDCDPYNTAWSRLTVEANEPRKTVEILRQARNKL